MFNLNGKAALITGGGSGIGRASAIALSKFGAKIFVFGRRENKLKETADIIKSAGGVCEFLAGDITDSKTIKAFFEKHKREKIDILVNNAGVLGTCPQDFTNTTKKEYDEVINTNVGGTFEITQEFIKQLFTHNSGGSIVNISSICAKAKNSNYISYAASKSAMLGFSSAIAARYGHYGIRSNVILPGIIETEMSYLENPNFALEKENLANVHPVGRIGTPQDVANAVVFLASDASSFITGTTLLVDGGLLVAD